MPNFADEANLVPGVVKILLYGKGHSKKTWWALRAAEYGYKILFLDGDNDKGKIARAHLSDAAKSRIWHVDLNSNLTPALYWFIVYLIKNERFIWDEQKEINLPIGANLHPEHSYYSIDPRKFRNDLIVVVDTITALKTQLNWRYAALNKVDLTDAKKTDWDGYRWTGDSMTFFINGLKHLPCNVIAIGHEDVYEKRKDIQVSDGKGGFKSQSVVEWARQQIKSTSGPNAMQIGKDFDDVYWLYNESNTVTKVDLTSGKWREGGSRIIEPRVYDWDKFQFNNVAKAYGIPVPEDSTSNVSGIDWYAPGEDMPLSGGKVDNNVTTPIIKPEGGPKKVSNLKTLMAKNN